MCCGGGMAVLVGPGGCWPRPAAAEPPGTGWGAAGAAGRVGAPVFQAGPSAAVVHSISRRCRGGWSGSPGARGRLKRQRHACGERRPLRPSAADGTEGLSSTARPRAGKAHHHGQSRWHISAEVDTRTSRHQRAGAFLRAGLLVRSGRLCTSRVLRQPYPPLFLVLTLLCLWLSLRGAALLQAGSL